MEPTDAIVGPVVVAESPFDDSNADVILRSSDSVLFYVHKLLLSLASPVFGTMFTLPDPHPREVYDGRPCIAVSDDATHLLLLLSWCDPRCIQTTHLSDLQMVLETADKYGMESIMKRVERLLILSKEIIKTAPLKVFAIAVRYRCEELARIAAKDTLHYYPLVKLRMRREPELKHLSAFAFINLQEYHVRCVAAAVELASEYRWTREFDNLTSHFSGSCQENEDDEDCETNCPNTTNRFGTFIIWWINYMELAAEDLRERPIGSTVSEPLLLSKIHSKISRGLCSRCKDVGHDYLVKFAQFLAERIDDEISEVPFSVEY